MSRDAPAPHAEALGDRHEVGVRLLVVAGAEVGVAAVAAVEAVLPLHHHAQVLVVQQQHLDRQLLACRQQASSWMFIRKLPSPSMSMTSLVRVGRLRAHRGGQAEAHRPRPPLVIQCRGVLNVEVLRRPHLVLADAGRDDRVVELAAVA